jgi:2'-5' RNA ligase
MPQESALIVPVPAAESLVAEWRAQCDPAASRGVPAHITLLYPFVPPSHVNAETNALRHLFNDVSSFDFVLTEVRRFRETAYLHPEPADPFVRVTEALAAKWPQFLPYGGAFSSIVPHLTVADRCTGEVLDRVERELTSRLPLKCRATEACLMCSDVHGMWSIRERFSFGLEFSLEAT